jgi:dihydrofolate reductase
VVANISLSLDGRVAGPGGDYDMSWIVPHALTEDARTHMVQVTGPPSTALLGRKTYQGFSSYWPAVAGDMQADPRDRAFARWLNAVEKVVFCTTLTDTKWPNARILADDPADAVRRLRAQDGGDIIVLASASIIRNLLAADDAHRQRGDLPGL